MLLLLLLRDLVVLLLLSVVLEKGRNDKREECKVTGKNVPGMCQEFARNVPGKVSGETSVLVKTPS